MKIKCYERIERTYEEKVKSGTLTDENGIKREILPFEYQPIELKYDDEGIEHVNLLGTISYKVRFAIKNEGKYILEITFENGEIKTEEFIAEGFSGDGFVGVSKKDKRYFSYQNGKPFYSVGINLAFPRACGVSNGKEFGLSGKVKYMGLRQYERWFKRCSENGVNVARVWVGHDYFSPDTEDANVFNLAQFTKIDMLLTLAKKYDIKLKITMEQFRWFFYDKKDTSNVFRYFNKNLYLNGEKCSCAKEWLTEDKWKEAWLNKIREFAKRYSGDTEIFAVELWNEMNCMGEEWGRLYPEIVKWNEEMIPKIKKLFPDNMITNSIGSLDSEEVLESYNTFPWSKCDFKQMHRYLDQGGLYDDTRHNPIEMIQGGLKRIQNSSMPFFVAETGAVNNNHSGEFKYYSCDDRGIIFADCVYTPVFMGCAGAGNIWHWDDRYVESKNLYRYYKPLADMISCVDFPEEGFETLDFSDDEAYIFILKGKTVSLGFIRNKSDCWNRVLRDLEDVETINQKTVDFNGKSVTDFKIWENDTTKISINDGKIKFENILYGTIFKIDEE